MTFVTRQIRQRRIRRAQMLLVAALATVVFLPRIDLPKLDNLQFPGISTVNAAETVE